MYRLLRLGLIVLTTFLLSACLELEERLRIASDGSGEKTTVIDLSGMLANPFMKMAMEEAMQQEDAPDLGERIDSSFNLYDGLAAANPQWTEQERELVERLDGHLLLDYAAGEGRMTTRFAFSDLREVERLTQILRDANEPEGKEDAGLGGLGNASALLQDYSFKRGRFAQQSRLGDAMNKFTGGEEMEEEALEMVRGMFEEARVVQLIEFPGRIRKVRGFPGHVVDGNTLRVEFDLLELLENPNVAVLATSGEVKYKK